jgi:hypothetical protein
LTIRHSQFAIRRLSPFGIHHSLFAIRHSPLLPLATRRSLLAVFPHSPFAVSSRSL